MHWFFFSILNAFFQSLHDVFGKNAAQKVDVLAVAWSQRFFALFLIVPLVFITHSFEPLNQTFWIATIANAVLNTIVAFLYFQALKVSPMSLTLPIVALSPVFLLITSPLMVGEFPKPLGVLGILITVTGAYILNLSKRSKSPFEPLLSIVKERGSRLMLIVAILWGFGSNLDKIAIRNSNPILYIFVFICMVLFFLTIILLVKKVSFKLIFKNSKLLAPVGLAEGTALLFQMIAYTMTIVPNVIAVKRSSTMFGVIWGKVYFKEENFRERITGAAIMIIGVILIVIS